MTTFSLAITLRHSHRVIVDFTSAELRAEALRILRRDLISRECWFLWWRHPAVWSVTDNGKLNCVVLVRDVVAVSVV